MRSNLVSKPYQAWLYQTDVKSIVRCYGEDVPGIDYVDSRDINIDPDMEILQANLIDYQKKFAAHPALFKRLYTVLDLHGHFGFIVLDLQRNEVIVGEPFASSQYQGHLNKVASVIKQVFPNMRITFTTCVLQQDSYSCGRLTAMMCHYLSTYPGSLIEAVVPHNLNNEAWIKWTPHQLYEKQRAKIQTLEERSQSIQALCQNLASTLIHALRLREDSQEAEFILDFLLVYIQDVAPSYLFMLKDKLTGPTGALKQFLQTLKNIFNTFPTPEALAKAPGLLADARLAGYEVAHSALLDLIDPKQATKAHNEALEPKHPTLFDHAQSPTAKRLEPHQESTCLAAKTASLHNNKNLQAIAKVMQDKQLTLTKACQDQNQQHYYPVVNKEQKEQFQIYADKLVTYQEDSSVFHAMAVAFHAVHGDEILPYVVTTSESAATLIMDAIRTVYQHHPNLTAKLANLIHYQPDQPTYRP